MARAGARPILKAGGRRRALVIRETAPSGIDEMDHGLEDGMNKMLRTGPRVLFRGTCHLPAPAHLSAAPGNHVPAFIRA
ncbi:MAG: hypothetical protein OXC93_03610 [Rhodospirillaceae bacterium]|nr:hypothetical protein [Rhodospirillaceae bacterium]